MDTFPVIEGGISPPLLAGIPERTQQEPHHAPVYVGAFSKPDADALRCLLPVGLDLNALCETTAEGAEWPPKHRHKLAFVVHSIVRGFQQRHATGEDDTARGVALNVVLLRSLLGKGARDFAKDAVDALTAWGVIERVGNHRAGKRSRRYCLAAPFAMAPTEWQCFAGPRLVAKLRETHRKETARCAALEPSFAFVAQNLAAVTLADSGHAEAIQHLPTMTSPWRRAAWLLSLDDLREPALRFTHSEKTGRVYHGVANCPKELRRHLLIDGEPVAEVDIGAAQFFLLLGLFPGPSEERSRFAAAVASGHFYEHLFKRVFKRGEGGRWGDGSVPLHEVWRKTGGIEQRDAFKEHALRKLLYERLYPATRETGIWPAFADEFPTLAGAVAFRRYSKAATRAFCCEMQRREAGLVLGRIIPRIRQELSGCKPVSIHDAVMCQAGFASAVRRIMIEEAATLYGATPAVKVTMGVGAAPVLVCVA